MEWFRKKGKFDPLIDRPTGVEAVRTGPSSPEDVVTRATAGETKSIRREDPLVRLGFQKVVVERSQRVWDWNTKERKAIQLR